MEILDELVKKYREGLPPLPELCPEHVKSLYEHLKKYLYDDCRMMEVRLELGLHNKNIIWQFDRWVGQKPKAFQLHHHMILAERLLRETPCSILSIANALGYPCQDNLGKNFKRKYKMSPSEYRQQVWAGPEENGTFFEPNVEWFFV